MSIETSAECIENCYENCLKEIRLYENYVSAELYAFIHKLVELLQPKSIPDAWKNDIAQRLEKLVQPKNYYISVLLYSAIIDFTKDPVWLESLVSYIMENICHFTKNNLYFLYTQMAYKPMVDQRLDTPETNLLMLKLLKEIINKFQQDNSKEYAFIPIQKRNPNIIVVLTEQFLGVAHGPSKTAMDRCKVIIEKMGKQVLLINTAETLSMIGKLPFSNMRQGNYCEELASQESILWKGTSIPYFQCEQNMPEYDTMNLILDTITRLKPYYIVSMNGSSITCNLANQIIPVISINCGLSRLALTTVSFQALGQKMTPEQKNELQLYGMPEYSVIESEFTYSFREQTEHYTREQFGIKEDVFLISVIGTRLHDEVTREFFELLDEIVSEEREIVFVGGFDNYEEAITPYTNLRAHSYYTGTILDVVAFGEICDLYVNPTRKGAGGSILEVMLKGVPSVTCNYGDAAACVGPDFCVADYGEMKEKILRYYSDPEYYREMAQKAVARVEYITNNDNAFITIIEEAMRRECENELYRFL